MGDATSEAAGGPTSETCAGSRTLRFFPERTGEEDEKRPPRVDVHYGRARGLKGSENSLKVEIPAIRGAGYVLVVLDIYSGLDIPEDLGFEIRSKLGGRTAVDDAEDGRIGGTDEKKEEEKNVLFQKILREPTVKFGLTATAPEGIRGKAGDRGCKSERETRVRHPKYSFCPHVRSTDNCWCASLMSCRGRTEPVETCAA